MFYDRFEAGALLAAKLREYADRPGAVILAIPRGGLAIGHVLAQELNLPLDILMTKKIGHPQNPEYAIGAVSLYGEIVDEAALESGEISRSYVNSEIRRIRQNLKKKYAQYRDGEKPIALLGKTVIIADDGVATGRSLMVAIEAVKRERPERIVVAVPVGPPSTIERLREAADQVVCLETPEDFAAIGQFYRHFEPVEDKQAIELLKVSHHVT